MRLLGLLLIFLILYPINLQKTRVSTPAEQCVFVHNITEIDKVTYQTIKRIEHCIYLDILNRNKKDVEANGAQELINPPDFDALPISIEDFNVYSVDMSPKSTNQFNIVAEIQVSWNDSRLVWREDEWKVKNFILHDNHDIWAPHFYDTLLCGRNDDCLSKMNDVSIRHDGIATGRLTFKSPSICSIDFYRYPEETNDCCIVLSPNNTFLLTYHYEINTKKKDTIDKKVLVLSPLNGTGQFGKIYEGSSWNVQSKRIDVVGTGRSNDESLRLCITAQKKMTTLSVALELPVTVAALLVLVAPLFGDLKSQVYIKLIALCIQTICFLFLCSIAPEDGFQGMKPKIYKYYEFLFYLTFFNILVGLCFLAAFRIPKKYPPSHNCLLVSKMINKIMSCGESDPTDSYERQFNEFPDGSLPPQITATDAPSYKKDWAQVYLAGNYAFSFFSFILFALAYAYQKF
uniref:Neur_chan_LBD domain-containing protein n=1 Tax=Rhabditophanes sp. KR3021 TaxID=114890 RepID=A0AC35U035_9BILA